MFTKVLVTKIKSDNEMIIQKLNMQQHQYIKASIYKNPHFALYTP